MSALLPDRSGHCPRTPRPWRRSSSCPGTGRPRAWQPIRNSSSQLDCARRGGQSVDLSECNCKLAIYAVPRKENIKPVLQPDLIAIDVEKYQAVPGAEVIFPQGGAYELEFSGTAKDNESFSPFKLTYTVNVKP